MGRVPKDSHWSVSGTGKSTEMKEWLGENGGNILLHKKKVNQARGTIKTSFFHPESLSEISIVQRKQFKIKLNYIRTKFCKGAQNRLEDKMT